ncbi:hypothetical protein [Streptomyces sp. WL006]|uniref:hypothetical protein n=1 Tax=Streptomyces sp. WL006 TaxID=3423915 RepID=UPI003F6A8375
MTHRAPDPADLADVIAQGERDLADVEADQPSEVDLADVIAQGEQDLADVEADRAHLSSDPPEMEDP